MVGLVTLCYKCLQKESVHILRSSESFTVYLSKPTHSSHIEFTALWVAALYGWKQA